MAAQGDRHLRRPDPGRLVGSEIDHLEAGDLAAYSAVEDLEVVCTEPGDRIAGAGHRHRDLYQHHLLDLPDHLPSLLAARGSDGRERGRGERRQHQAGGLKGRDGSARALSHGGLLIEWASLPRVS